ncbi:uncharacterized protein LOC105831795 isoform X4 [Monomorium pharaonis]|uniref:uncharacterized protein LOC105831795 isoform X4 n=1 Tax=Monomorium pharaonis TaxID=307658 RepID=UPI0017464717|nr:uncharacterized protein LOC105831795 isoform X4 [Monomorium pharaonis]
MEEIYVPVHDNSSSIERTLRLMSYTSWFMGVGIAHPLKCPKFVTIIIRIIHLVICTVILIKHLQFVSSFVYFKSNTSVNKWFFAMGNMIYCVSTYYSIYHGIRQYEWPELMDKMKQLDRKIRRDVHMNDQPVRYMVATAILMTFACSPLFTIVLVLYDFMKHSNDTYVTDYAFYYMMARSLINSFVFDVVVYVLYYRYRTTNKMLGHLDKLSDAPLIALKIRRIRELHNDICDLVIMINDIHGLYLLLFSLNCFFMVTTLLYMAFIYIENEDYETILIVYTVAIMYTTQFGLICWICTLARQEFEKTKIIMCAIALKCQSMKFDKLNNTRNQLNLKVRPLMEDTDSNQNFNRSNSHNWNYDGVRKLLRTIIDQDHVNNEINGFLIQLQHRQVSFTACDFFEISNNLFCSFVGVSLTYLTVFIEFTEMK